MNPKILTLSRLVKSEERRKAGPRSKPPERMDLREAVLAPKLKRLPIPKEIQTLSGCCSNGGCTRPIYRGKRCYRCWVGDKWTSMWQRVNNSNKNCPSYVGIPFKITRSEFVRWAIENPPPINMDWPSVDRIISAEGYSLSNIRWLEFRRNCANTPTRHLE